MDNKKNGIPKLRFPGFTGAWEQRKLGEITKTHSLKQYISEAFDHGKYMVIQQGENPIAGYANGDPFENFKDVTLFGDHTLSLFKPQEKFFVASDGIKILSPSLKMNGMFYYYLLEKYRPQSEGYKRHFTIMKKSTALFPIEIDEQIKISNFLKELDSLIALHQRKLEHLQEQKKGLLQKMFPKNGETVPEVRFPGFTDAWEQRKLGDFIIEFHEKTTVNDQYPILTSSRKGIFLQTDYYSGNQIASKDNTGYNIVPFGYFTYRHMSDDNIFRFNINKIVDKGIVSTLYPVFTTNKYLDSRYLQIQLNHGNEFAKYALLQKQGGSRTYMYLSKLKKLVLTMPKSTSEQKTISNFFDTLDSLITLHQRKLEHLELMKKGLLQQMFV